MNYQGKFCVVCGRRIPELSLRRRTCSEFCHRRKKAGYAPYINCSELPFKDLTVLQKQAQSEGLSYGKYMAKLYNEQRRERECR